MDYDPNGQWILYQLREDWQQSTLGVVNGTDMEPAAKYVGSACWATTPPARWR